MISSVPGITRTKEDKLFGGRWKAFPYFAEKKVSWNCESIHTTRRCAEKIKILYSLKLLWSSWVEDDSVRGRKMSCLKSSPKYCRFWLSLFGRAGQSSRMGLYSLILSFPDSGFLCSGTEAPDFSSSISFLSKGKPANKAWKISGPGTVRLHAPPHVPPSLSDQQVAGWHLSSLLSEDTYVPALEWERLAHRKL